MVPKNGKLDSKFWFSVAGLFLAIIGTWITLSKEVTANTVKIDSLGHEIDTFRLECGRRMDRLEETQHEILMELRK